MNFNQQLANISLQHIQKHHCVKEVITNHEMFKQNENDEPIAIDEKIDL